MDSKTLLTLFDGSKEYLMNMPKFISKSLEKYQAGFDPLVPLKELKRGMEVIEEILKKGENKTKDSNEKNKYFLKIGSSELP